MPPPTEPIALPDPSGAPADRRGFSQMGKMCARALRAGLVADANASGGIADDGGKCSDTD